MAGSLQEQLIEIEKRLALIELRLEQLFVHADVEPREAPGGDKWWGGSGDEPADSDEVSERVRALVAEGKTLQAIKVHREQTGLGLKEAQDAIERLEG